MAGKGRPGRETIEGCLDPHDPSGESRKDLWLSLDRFRLLNKSSLYKGENLHTAVEVLLDPERVWSHIRDGDDDEFSGWCYVGCPKEIRSGYGDVLPFPPGHVFTVYVDGDGYVFEWGKERSDPNDPLAPERAPDQGRGPQGRFGDLVWTKS